MKRLRFDSQARADRLDFELIFEYKMNERDVLNFIKLNRLLVVYVMREGYSKAIEYYNVYNPKETNEYGLIDKINEKVGFEAFRFIDSHFRERYLDYIAVEEEATLWADTVNHVVHYFVSDGDNKIIDYTNTKKETAEKVYQRFQEFRDCRFQLKELSEELAQGGVVFEYESEQEVVFA